MTAVEFDVKQSKIQEFADLLKQRENAVQKQNFSLELTEYETQLIEAPYKSWLLISTMLQSSEIEDDIYEDFLLNPENYTTSNGEIIVNPDYEAEEKEKEQERINNLTMTALDFITGLQLFGLTLETINSYLEANLELKMQLTYCQNVYCSVVKQLCPLTVGDFTLTEEIVEAMFLYKAGEISLDDITALVGA